MKNTMRLLSLLLLCAGASWAQDSNEIKGKTTFGIQAGWMQSQLYGADLGALALADEQDARQRFFVGVTAFSTVGKHLGFKHEMLYQQYGSSFKRSAADESVERADLKMSSLKLVPFSPTVKWGGLQIYAGPYVNILLDASIDAVDAAGNRSVDKNIFGTADEDTESYKYLQKMDFGFVAGVDYIFAVGISVGVYYSQGFAPIFDNANSHGLEQTPGIATWKIYNKSCGLSLGYSF